MQLSSGSLNRGFISTTAHQLIRQGSYSLNHQMAPPAWVAGSHITMEATMTTTKLTFSAKYSNSSAWNTAAALLMG